MPLYADENNIMAPARNAEEVTPNDGADLSTETRGIVAAAAGNIEVDMAGGQKVTLAAAAGIPLAVRVKRIYATGTTATGIVALW